MGDGPGGTGPELPGGRPPPRGCNPVVFGVVAATIQIAVILWLLYGR